MAKTLVIVESPTKSKTIEKFLGKNYTVKASMGHLRDLPKSTLGVTFLPDEEHANEFEPKYINIRGKGDLIKSLKAEAKKADKVLLATDLTARVKQSAGIWHLSWASTRHLPAALNFMRLPLLLSRTLSSIRAALTWIWLMHSRHAAF